MAGRGARATRMTRWLGQGCHRHPRLTSTKRLGEAPPTPLGLRLSRPSPPLASRAGGGKCAPPTFDVRRPLLGRGRRGPPAPFPSRLGLWPIPPSSAGRDSRICWPSRPSSPLWGDRLGRRPSEKGVAGHRPLGRSRPPRHQPQGQAASDPSGLGPLRLTRLSASSTRRSMPGDPLLARPSAESVLPHKGGGEVRTHAVVCIL